MQENLRKQIQEQRRLKELERQQEKTLERQSMERAKQETHKDEKYKLELKRKLMDRKEMVDKQLKAHQLQKNLRDEEKKRYGHFKLFIIHPPLCLDVEIFLLSLFEV